MEVVFVVLRMAAGGFFVWSGVMKMSAAGRFWRQATDYEILGARSSRFLASFVPPFEFLVGLLFAAGFYPKVLGGSLITLVIVFSVAMLIVMARGKVADCGCGGAESQIRPALIIRNALVVGAIVCGMFSPVQDHVGAPVVTGLVVIAGILIAVSIYRSIGARATK